MSSPARSRSRVVATATAAGVAATGVLLAGPSAGAVPAPGIVRVDQVGYGLDEAKHAYLMATTRSAGAKFTVVDARGRTAYAGRVGASRGGWNAQYTAVHPIDFSRLHRPGTYRIKVAGRVIASPAFRIADTARLTAPLAQDSTHFFQVQRDGANVVRTRVARKPAHLTDRKATVYEHPVFTGDGGDEIAAPLKPVAGAAKVDVEGGWFDAGDFVKFTHASAYSTAELLYAQRSTGHNAALDAEARHGVTWLDKVWDAKRKVLYVQVGIGTGSEEFGFVGDHDVWRLPEADDALNVKPGDSQYFIKYRPVFAAVAPGGRISPNLAGRVAASFALAAQVESRRNPRLARHYLEEGASIFALARTTDVGELVTAFPHAYYPEDSWEDDLEFGATELATAGRLLGDRRSAGWLRAATRWANAYLASDHRDTLNLYDTSALAHTDLVRLLRAERAGGEQALLADLRRQLDNGVAAAANNPFGSAADVTGFDVATRSLGYAATARLYRSITGDRKYDAFGTHQRNFVLGANAWGTSLVIGAGTVYPQCPQHQVANLAGRTIGAVVNGPNGADNFEDLGIPDGANACPADGVNRFAAFDTAEARYLDDVRAWPSSEPAIDFTSTGLLAFALTTKR